MKRFLLILLFYFLFCGITLGQTSPSEWYAKGIELAKQGNNIESLNAFNEAIELDSNYVWAWINKGGILVRLEKPDEAIQALDRAIVINPQMGEPWGIKGDALKKQKKYSEAIIAYEKAIRLKPSWDGPWTGKGMALISLGNYKEALQCLNQAIGLNPKSSLAWYEKGNALFNLGNNRNSWLIKVNSSGGKEWDKFFGGSGWDEGLSVQPTSDGGYILVGYTESYGAGQIDAWLIKTDSSGNKEWDRTFGGSGDDLAYSVQPTSDGGYILAGYTKSYGAGQMDAWLIKTDSSGNKEWDKTLGGSDDDSAYSVQPTSDGGYVLAGYTKSYGTDSDAWLIKTDKSGNKLWGKTFGGSGVDRVYSIRSTGDGGYIIAGVIDLESPSVWGNAWLIKTDSSGNKEWNKTFGESFSSMAYSVQPTGDGGYILGGSTLSNGSVNVWLIKTDSSGNMEWDKVISESNMEKAYSVQPTSDGGYVLAGYSKSLKSSNMDACLIKTNTSGYT